MVWGLRADFFLSAPSFLLKSRERAGDGRRGSGTITVEFVMGISNVENATIDSRLVDAYLVILRYLSYID